jgi:putative FmdB family regulatory protein
MPNYDYMCGGCNHSFEEFLLMKDRKKPCKKPCPKCGKKEIKQYIASAPVVIDPVRLGITRPDSGFKEVISKIKKAHPRHGMRDY